MTTLPAEQDEPQSGAFLPEPTDLLTIHEVRQRVSLGQTAIYEMIKRGEFPAPYRLGTRTVRWKRGDLDEWREGLKR